MSFRSSTDCVRATTIVPAEPDAAFAFFTTEVDLWWRRGPRFRHGHGRPSVMRFEGGEGGRLVEVYTDEKGGAFEVGRVLAWKPGDRLLFQWRGNNFEPGLVTEVEVRFERAERGTRVTLEHRGWSRIPRDHAVRHGQVDAEFVARLGTWWGALATSYRETAE